MRFASSRNKKPNFCSLARMGSPPIRKRDRPSADRLRYGINIPKSQLRDRIACMFDRLGETSNPQQPVSIRLMQFRLTTYNIHKGIGGVDRRYDPDRIVQAVGHCNPDILFLQEVDDGVPRSRHDRQVEVLGEALGLKHHVYQRNVKLKVGHYGNAILSRFPLTDHQDIDLTIPMKKKRRALAAHCRMQIDGHSRTVLLLNVHLGLAGFERKMQLRRLLATELVRRTHQETAVLLAGDFNDVWGNLGRGILDTGGFQSATGLHKTFPAFMPMRPLDRVYFRGNMSIDHGFASRTDIARRASDHLPLVADCILQ